MREHLVNTDKNCFPSLMRLGLATIATAIVIGKLYRQLLYTRYPNAFPDTDEYIHERIHRLRDAAENSLRSKTPKLWDHILRRGESRESLQKELDEITMQISGFDKTLEEDHRWNGL